MRFMSPPWPGSQARVKLTREPQQDLNPNRTGQQHKQELVSGILGEDICWRKHLCAICRLSRLQKANQSQ